MAHYPTIVRLRPEVRDFIRNRHWVHRGEVIAYGPNVRCDSFSTDAAGFRHGVLDGKTWSVADCLRAERYGLVLGSSNLYGFGVAGNENAMPSLLGERFGFPFANISIPEANSRNLFSLLMTLMARAPKPPAVVLHLSGGDFTSFCFTSIADPLFGTPSVRQTKAAIEERGGRPAAARQFPALLAFSNLWTNAIANLCQAREIPLVLGNDTTFFEKDEPSSIERECRLGTPSNAFQAQQFDIHKRFVGAFYAKREAFAEMLGVPLAGPGKANAIGFIDEFHYDRDGTRAVADDLAAAVAALL